MDTVEIPATGIASHNIIQGTGQQITKGNDVTFTSNADDVPQTGDSSNFVLWITLMLASAMALIGTALFSKKRQAK